jgi:hypothetical protein
LARDQRARRLLVAATLVVGVLTLLPGVTAAASSSTVSLGIKDGFRFHGVVSSPAAACVIGRRVNLVRIEHDGSRTVVTHAFTTESGHHSTTIPMQSGNQFFARIKRDAMFRGKVCLGDRSPTRTA